VREFEQIQSRGGARSVVAVTSGVEGHHHRHEGRGFTRLASRVAVRAVLRQPTLVGQLSTGGVGIPHQREVKVRLPPDLGLVKTIGQLSRRDERSRRNRERVGERRCSAGTYLGMPEPAHVMVQSLKNPHSPFAGARASIIRTAGCNAKDSCRRSSPRWSWSP